MQFCLNMKYVHDCYYLKMWFSTCGTPTTSGMSWIFRWYTV